MKERISPGLALFFLAPLLGELVSGHQGPAEFFNPLSYILTALPYGCGALICRELVVRRKKGWLSLLLLALVYGLYEEGVVARSIFDPKWEELGALAEYNHYAGLNWTYTIVLLHFHLAISIYAPIALAEMLYPERRHESWIDNRALRGCFAVMALWPVPFWAITGYIPPIVGFTGVWLAIIGLTWLALHLPAQPLPPVKRAPPRPFQFGLLAGVNMTVIFVGVFMAPEMDSPPPLASMVIFLLLVDALAFLLALRRSGNTAAWEDRHRFAFVVGLLAFFIVFGFVGDMDEGFAGKSLTSLTTLYLLWRMGGWMQEKRQQAPGEGLPGEALSHPPQP